MGRPDCTPGITRAIPGGVLVFQSAMLNMQPGEPSLFRYTLQFGAPRDAAVTGNWLFNQLRGSGAALHIAGHLIPLDHRTIINSLKQVA